MLQCHYSLTCHLIGRGVALIQGVTEIGGAKKAYSWLAFVIQLLQLEHTWLANYVSTYSTHIVGILQLKVANEEIMYNGNENVSYFNWFDYYIWIVGGKLFTNPLLLSTRRLF